MSGLHKHGNYQRQKSSIRTQRKYGWPGNISNSVVEVCLASGRDRREARRQKQAKKVSQNEDKAMYGCFLCTMSAKLHESWSLHIFIDFSKPF